MIEAQGLSKTFFVHEKEPGLKGSLRSLFRRKRLVREAVKGVSFTIGEGEIVGMVGANGAGKTTVVKMLAGIIHPTTGRARVLGYDPWQRDDRMRRQIALVMGQKAQLWWDLPAGDSFLLLREIYQIPHEQFATSLAYLAEVLEAGELMKVQLRRLSLGERMKMELIAALLHSPRVVFLDEPTIGLDLSAQRAIRDFLLRYRRDHRPAMIITSHYMEDIERLCERILILREGELVYDGPLAAIRRHYGEKKVLTARLDPELSAETLAERVAAVDLDRLGRVVSRDGDALRLEVPRERVPEVAGHLLAALPVADLAIEEEDIAVIIEAILKGRGQVVP
ncbi:MAG TPA: ATP-binding cassette domain-containing protein [Thermoanaerobaculia bacterium]|nr:ATP-binding cassette domain-containing protein [Thermoanaerobaculia bacterium]